MEYRYLKAFILTAEHSSFSKAADALSIAQSAVSRQIKLLEESIGEELIIRSSKKVLLTHKGKELYFAANHFDKLALDIFQKEDTRPIKIGILHGLVKNWFVPILIKFYKKHSRDVYVHILDVHELKEGIEEGKFDIVFTIENIQSELITSLRLFEEKLVIISKDEINRKKLHDYRWIVYGEEDNIYKLSKKRSSQILRIDSITEIVELVRNGIGIAVVPDHVLRKNESLNVYDTNVSDKSAIYMSTLNYKTIPTHIAELKQFF